jgi:hypothetical protein
MRFMSRRRRQHAPAPDTNDNEKPSGVGEPPVIQVADDAELDALRAELVRELDKLASGDDGSAGFRRG